MTVLKLAGKEFRTLCTDEIAAYKSVPGAQFFVRTLGKFASDSISRTTLSSLVLMAETNFSKRIIVKILMHFKSKIFNSPRHMTIYAFL